MLYCLPGALWGCELYEGRFTAISPRPQLCSAIKVPKDRTGGSHLYVHSGKADRVHNLVSFFFLCSFKCKMLFRCSAWLHTGQHVYLGKETR